MKKKNNLTGRNASESNRTVDTSNIEEVTNRRRKKITNVVNNDESQDKKGETVTDVLEKDKIDNSNDNTNDLNSLQDIPTDFSSNVVPPKVSDTHVTVDTVPLTCVNVTRVTKSNAASASASPSNVPNKETQNIKNINEAATPNKKITIIVNSNKKKEKEFTAQLLDEKTHHHNLPTFLCEPFHTPNLFVTTDDIKRLDESSKNDKWLSTNLIDFLIKYGTPYWKPSDVLVPTSNIGPLLDLFNNKASSHDPRDIQFVEKARKKYKKFCSNQYRIISVSCENGHFLVLFMILDTMDDDGDFFHYVQVYDSLQRMIFVESKKIQFSYKIHW